MQKKSRHSQGTTEIPDRKFISGDKGTKTRQAVLDKHPRQPVETKKMYLFSRAIVVYVAAWGIRHQ